MYTFEIVEINKLDIEEFYNFDDKLIFTTLEWIEFISRTQNIKPIIIRIQKDNIYIGYFTAFIFSKFGLKIIGSPFRGWTTPYMGFDLLPSHQRTDIIRPLWQFLKQKYNCIYMEIIDRKITVDEARCADLIYEEVKSYEMRIDKLDEELLLSFAKSCRKQIRQFERRGGIIKFVEPNDEFVSQYYKQLIKVFEDQGLVPTYNATRVKELINCLSKIDGSLICMQAYNEQGICISSSIGFGYRHHCYAWGSASDKTYNYNQGKYMRWAAIRHWRDCGMIDYDLMGQRDYKKAFNPYEIIIPRISMYKYKFLLPCRNMAQKLYWVLNKIKGTLIRFKSRQGIEAARRV